MLLRTRSRKLEIGYITNECTPELLLEVMLASMRARRQDFPGTKEKIEIGRLY
jgi:hypothetical protein